MKQNKKQKIIYTCLVVVFIIILGISIYLLCRNNTAKKVVPSFSLNNVKEIKSSAEAVSPIGDKESRYSFEGKFDTFEGVYDYYINNNTIETKSFRIECMAVIPKITVDEHDYVHYEGDVDENGNPVLSQEDIENGFKNTDKIISEFKDKQYYFEDIRKINNDETVEIIDNTPSAKDMFDALSNETYCYNALLIAPDKSQYSFTIYKGAYYSLHIVIMPITNDN